MQEEERRRRKNTTRLTNPNPSLSHFHPRDTTRRTKSPFFRTSLTFDSNSNPMTKDKKANSNNGSQLEDAMDTSAVNAGENGAANENDGPAYEDKFKFMNAMSSPVAPKKLAKKIFKCIKQATKQKNYVRLGLRETQKYIRRGEKGLVVLAGNVSPIDIYSHMPVVCEEANIPYVFVPSKEDLGGIIRANRTCCLLLVRSHADYKELFDEIVEKVNKLEPGVGKAE